MKKFLMTLAIVFAGMFFISTDASAAEQVCTLVEGESTDYYTVDGTTVTVKMDANEKLAGPKIEAALAYAKNYATDSAPITVVVPAGDYTFYDADNTVMKYGMYGLNSTSESIKDTNIKYFRGLHIYSNTTLNVTGCIFRLDDGADYATRFLEFGYTDGVSGTGTEATNLRKISYGGTTETAGTEDYNHQSTNGGYTGFKNITINGGTWVGSTSTKTMMKFYHATNVQVRNIILQEGDCQHMVEASALQNFIVSGCTFTNTGRARSNAERCEALQLDVSCNDNAMWTGYNDGTPLNGVTITGCSFTNVLDGVGTHSSLIGSYHNNIIIDNNTFTNVDGYAITGLGYQNVVITNNTIQGCGGGIWLKSLASPSTGAASDVIFTRVLNGTQASSGAISYAGNIRITNNTVNVVTTSKTGTKGIEVGGQVVSTTAYSNEGDGIPVGNYYISDVTITGNTVSGPAFGIAVSDVVNANVSSNNITGTANTSNTIGVVASYGTTASQISGNTIFNMNSKGTGIYVDTASTVGDIASNVISADTSIGYCGANGITVTGGSTVTGGINANTIYCSAARGINIEGSSVVYKIASNKIKGSYGTGIWIKNSLNSQAEITSNQILNTKKYGIYISGAPTNRTITISGNRIRGVKTSGKYAAIYTGACKFSVSGNKIGKYSYGIRTTASTKGSIYKNTFSKVTHQLYLDGTKTYDIKYSSSKVKAPTLVSGDDAFTVNTPAAVFKNLSGDDYSMQKYIITYSTSKTFKESKTKTTKTKLTEKTISELKNHKTYYVKVQGLRKFNKIKVYTNVTSAVKVKTQ